MQASFRYVYIPADHDAMQELVCEEAVSLENDGFIKKLKKTFKMLNDGLVDKEVLRKNMAEHAKQELSIDDAMMERLIDAESLDIFPIQCPTRITGFHSVSLYCDDKGIAKGLDVNVRATGLVHACGYVGQTIRGDAFISRIFDDEDAWYREDFALADMSSDAAWVKLTNEMRGKGGGNLSSMSSLTNSIAPAAVKVGPDGAGNAADMQESDVYQWRQADDEVEITAPLPDGVGKKELSVQFKAKSIKVVLKGEVLFAGDLAGPVEPDESTWTLGNDAGVQILQITLMKRDELHWPRCLA